MIVETARFGTVDVEANSIIKMPRGMFGFEEETEFCLVQHRPDTVFRWLQSTARPDLAFVVVDPSHFFEDYGFRLSSVEAEYLGLDDPESAMVLTTVSVSPGESEVTANLAGPIVINAKSLTGLQVALEDERYSTRQSLLRDDASGETLRRAA